MLSDPWQGKGLGTELLHRLLDIGRQERMGRIVAFILPDNIGMRRVCTKLGFSIRYDANAEAYRAEISLLER